MRLLYSIILVLLLVVSAMAAQEFCSTADGDFDDNVGAADATHAAKCVFNGTTGDVLDSIVVRGFISGGGTEQLTVSIYDDDSNKPGTRLATASRAINNSSYEFLHFSMGGTVSLTNGTTYWLAFATDGTNWTVRFENIGSTDNQFILANNNPATWGTSDGSQNVRFLIYGVNVVAATAVGQMIMITTE